jgi:hypothetical protein
MYNMTHVPVFVIVPVIAVLLGAVQYANAQSSDWILTIYPVNVPFGQSDIHIHVQGPFNANKDVNIANGQNPSVSFNMNGNDFPVGYQYKVCISATLIGAFLPNCNFFNHNSNEIAAWQISPS